MVNKKQSKFREGFVNGMGQTIGMILVAIIILGIVGGGVYAYNYYQYTKKVQALNSVRVSNVGVDIQTRAEGRFLLTSPKKDAHFFMSVNTTNQEYIYGPFKLNYRQKFDIQSGQTVIDVIYYLPENWDTLNATDIDVQAELKTRKEIASPPRRDPTFFRGKDYPETIPFDSIEITVDFVSVYTDTNETEYNFVSEIISTNSTINITNLAIMVPEDHLIEVLG